LQASITLRVPTSARHQKRANTSAAAGHQRSSNWKPTMPFDLIVSTYNILLYDVGASVYARGACSVGWAYPTG